MFENVQSMVEQKLQTSKLKVKIKIPEPIISEIKPTIPEPIILKPESDPSVPKKLTIKVKVKVKPPKPKPVVKIPQTDQSVWAEKYRPMTLDKIVGNTEQLAKVRDWFDKFSNQNKLRKEIAIKTANENSSTNATGTTKPKKKLTKKAQQKLDLENNIEEVPQSLLFIGGPGTSKTTIAHAVLREFGYDVMEYNASDVRSSSQLESTLDKIINNNRVEDNACPFGIVMDEIDGMSTGDKGGMSHLIKIISSSKVRNSNIPIICICNNYGDKKVSLLRKVCQEIFFNRPSITELVQVMNNVAECEGFTIEQSCGFKIAGIAQGDFRRLMYVLQSIYSLYNNENTIINNESNNTIINNENKVITSDIIYQNLDILNEKFVTLDSKQITSQIFGKLLGNDDIYRLYELEKSSIPMLVFENYVDLVGVQSTKIANKIENTKSFIDAIILSDKIEKTMFTSQSWFLQQIHCLSSCYMPNHYANKYTYVHLPTIKWTTTLRKYSQQKSTIKNINALSILFNKSTSQSVEDVQVIAELILFNLLNDNGNQREGIKMLKEYNLNVDDIEKLVRTDQLVGYYKNIYKSKHKTALTKLYSEMFPEMALIENGFAKSKKQTISDRLGKLKFSSKKEKEEKEDPPPKKVIARKTTSNSNIKSKSIPINKIKPVIQKAVDDDKSDGNKSESDNEESGSEEGSEDDDIF